MSSKSFRPWSLGVIALFAIINSILSPSYLRGQSAPNPILSSAQNYGNDNNSNWAGPVIVYFNNAYELLVTNHSNNDICYDRGPGNSCVDTGIQTGGSHQISAAVVGSTLYVGYVNTSNIFVLTSSTDGVNFTPSYAPQFSVGVPNWAFTPALVSYNNDLYIAYVIGGPSSGTPLYIEVGYSNNGGQSFYDAGYEYQYATSCQPSLAVYNGALWLGFLTPSSGSNYLVVGPIAGQSGSLTVYTNNAFSNSHTSLNGSTVYAGFALIGVPNEGLYVYAQSQSGSQNLWITGAADGVTFPAAQEVSNQQFRWTPSAVLDPNNTVYFAYQGDGNTTTYITYVTGY
jgi:hypothetical protein